MFRFVKSFSTKKLNKNSVARTIHVCHSQRVVRPSDNNLIQIQSYMAEIHKSSKYSLLYSPIHVKIIMMFKKNK